MIPKKIEICKPEDFDNLVGRGMVVSERADVANEANRLFAKWIEENSTVVYGLGMTGCYWGTNKTTITCEPDTHKGRLILIEPIEEFGGMMSIKAQKELLEKQLKELEEAKLLVVIPKYFYRERILSGESKETPKIYYSAISDPEAFPSHKVINLRFAFVRRFIIKVLKYLGFEAHDNPHR